MKKIFLLEAYFGQYDSHRTEVVKCFEDERDAKEYSEKYDRVVRKLSDFEGEAWEVVMSKNYGSGEDEEDYINCFHYKIWSKYNYRFNDYGGVKLHKMPLVEHRRKINIDNLLD